MREELEEALDGAATGRKPTREELITLIETPAGEVKRLFDLADRVRQRSLGDEVHLRGLIEFTNHCRSDCLYCGLRRSNRAIRRYRIPVGEIVQAAAVAARLGYRTIVLQGGEDPFYSGDDLAAIIEKVKQVGDFAITVSAGERDYEDYWLMREAGADRYLLKHETADPELFARLRPGTTLQERLKRLHWLRSLGFQIGSGNMIGLPGQTTETLAGDILLLVDLDVEMAGIGPFIPHPMTPLKECLPGELDRTLRVLAVARLALPQAHMPATTAAETLFPQGRQMALGCGANVIMPNFTPPQYRELYQIYPGKAGSGENAVESYRKIAAMLTSLGRPVATGRGDNKTWFNVHK